MTDTQKGYTAIYITIFLLAANGLFAKGLPLNSVDTTLIRSIIAGFFLLFIIALPRNKPINIKIKEGIILVILGAFLSIHWLTFFESMRISSVAIGMTALYTYPIFTVIFESLFARRKIIATDAMLAIIVFAGIYIISPLHQDLTVTGQGVLLGLISAITFAIRNVAQRHYCRHISPISAISIQCFSGVFLLLPFATPFVAMNIDKQIFMYLLLLGTVFTALPHVLMATSLRFLAAKSVAFIGCLQPVIGAVIAMFILDEVPTLNVILGGALILGAAAFETKRADLGINSNKIKQWARLAKSR